MDPLSLIGGISATGAIVAAVVQTLKNLSDARDKFEQADNTILFLMSELTAIKAAVLQIEDWSEYSFSKRPMREELAEAFRLSFAHCKLAMDILAEEVANLVSRNPFLARAKVVWNEVSMKAHADRLRSQVSALQLLIQAVHCQSEVQQTSLLRRPSSRRIIQQVADDATTLRDNRRYSKLGSGPPTIISHSESTVGSTAFDIDPELVNTEPYRRAKAHQDSKHEKFQSKNPFLKKSASDSKAREEWNRPEETVLTTSTHESRVDSGFYDEDADIVNPTAYRDSMKAQKAVQPSNNVHRSVSAPHPRHISQPTEQDGAIDQLTPMERFAAEPYGTHNMGVDLMDSHSPMDEAYHQRSTPESYTSPTQSSRKSAERKRSIRRTITRLASRAALPNSSLSITPSPSSPPGLRPNPKTVKRKSEPNIFQSIDFGTEDGLSAPEIVRAAQSASQIEIERLLEQRVDIEAKHLSSGRSALAVASHCGNDGVVALLLHHQAQVDVKDASDMTPLHLAASRGHFRVLQHLLRYHANVNALGPEKKTPLRFACDSGHFDCCVLLLEHRAKVDARDQHMFTALHAAAKIGDVEIAELLIKNGAAYEAKDANLMTALHYAADGDFDTVAELLLSHKADIESSGPQGKTPLSCACASGAYQTASLLISKRANVRPRAEDDMTPLHFAAFNDRADTADLLLQQKRVSIDCKTGSGRTPLHLAVISKSFSTTELLLRKRASIESQCNRDLRPLHYACDSADLIVAQLLVSSGAQIEASSQRGWRPLHLAAFRGSEAIIDLLLGKGAQIDVRDSSGERALGIASTYGHLGAVRLLLDRGSAMQLRIPKGPSLEDSPLCLAAKRGHVDVVREFLLRGASVRQRDEKNWPPLRYAAFHGHADVVQLLLQTGAPVLATEFGSTSVGSVSQFGFSKEVDMASRRNVLHLLKNEEERDRTAPRRLGETDGFLTVLPTSTSAGPSEAIRIYELG